MSVWRSPIPNKLPIVPKKKDGGSPAEEKAGDGRENGEGKVQGAVKGAEGKKHRPANGPVFRGIPLRRHLPSDERGSPVFLRENDRVLPSENVSVQEGGTGSFALAGEGGALKDIWHSCGKRFGSRVGLFAAGCNRFHFSVRQWIFGAPRQNRADPRNPQNSRAPAAWNLEAGSRKSRGRKLYLLPYRPLFSPAKPAKGRTREPAEGAAGDRKTKIGGTRDRRSNFAVFQIPFVPGIDKIGGKGAFFLADPIGERGDVVF